MPLVYAHIVRGRGNVVKCVEHASEADADLAIAADKITYPNLEITKVVSDGSGGLPTETVGGGGGATSTDWVRLNPIGGDTTEAVNWDAGAGSDPRNYDAPRSANMQYPTLVSAASDDGSYTTVTFTGCTYGGNSNLQDQIYGGCVVWTFPAVCAITGNAIDMTKPFHARWTIEAMESNALAYSPYFPDQSKIQMLCGLTTKPVQGWAGSPLDAQEYHTNVSSAVAGLYTGSHRHKFGLKAAASRHYGGSKISKKTANGLTNVAHGIFFQGLDRNPIFVGESWRSQSAANPPTYIFDQATQMDISTDTHAQWGVNTTAYWLLALGRTGNSASAVATTLKFKAQVHAVQIGTAWGTDGS